MLCTFLWSLFVWDWVAAEYLYWLKFNDMTAGGYTVYDSGAFMLNLFQK